MSSPIRVHGRFATARDTARTLGVSDARAKELIATAKEHTSRMVYRDAKTGEFTISSRNGKRASMTVSRSSNAHKATKHKSRAKRAKAGR
jgi:hypothetical protein